MVSGLTHLDELDPAAKVIHHSLKANGVPPFDRVVQLPTGHEEPEGGALSLNLLHPREPGLLHIGDMDIPFERGGPDGESQGLVQERDESVNEMVGSVVAAMDQRVVAIDDLHVRIVFTQRHQIGVVLPECGTGSANVGKKAARVAPVEVPDGGGQHDDVAGRLKITKYEFLHIKRRPFREQSASLLSGSQTIAYRQWKTQWRRTAPPTEPNAYNRAPMRTDEYTNIFELEDRFWWYRGIHDLIVAYVDKKTTKKSLNI